MHLFRCPYPSPRVWTDDGRSYGDVTTKFSQLDGLQFSLTMVLCWRALHAEALLLL